MNPPRLFLHAGLPRTATTSLQRMIFPNLQKISYLGKAWDNRGNYADENAKLVATVAELLKAHADDQRKAHELIGFLLSATLKKWKAANQFKQREASRGYAQTWADCIREVLDFHKQGDFLLSDESLIESVAGLSSREGHGLGIPLEQLAKTGLLKQSVVSIVLRNPADFIRASYYKNMEFELEYKGTPISFDKYVRQQLTVYLRKPSASRIFLAMHRPFVGHLQQYCPTLVVNFYEDLIESDHVVDLLLGFKTGEKPGRLKDLPRENSTFRDEEAVRFILSAKGIPKGIGMDEYAETFKSTLDHYGLTAIFSECALPKKHRVKAS